jgi:cytokinin riboside 5'-monophosphate phosphoribohydrolase
MVDLSAYPIHAVTVYCSSSRTIDPVFFDAGEELGAALARNGWALVYGGNHIGLMGVLADAVRAAGGKVIGITPQLMVDKGVADEQADELIVTDSMPHRKQLMEQRGDAFIALPGGLGTFEEIFEIIVGRQLRFHTKPVVLLNIDGYYDPLLQMIEHGIERRFIKAKARELYYVAADVAAAMEHLRIYRPPEPGEKWFEQAVPSGME